MSKGNEIFQTKFKIYILRFQRLITLKRVHLFYSRRFLTFRLCAHMFNLSSNISNFSFNDE